MAPLNRKDSWLATSLLDYKPVIDSTAFLGYYSMSMSSILGQCQDQRCVRTCTHGSSSCQHYWHLFQQLPQHRWRLTRKRLRPSLGQPSEQHYMYCKQTPGLFFSFRLVRLFCWTWSFDGSVSHGDGMRFNLSLTG